MKRKSILSCLATLVAVLFAGSVFAQAPSLPSGVTWPGAGGLADAKFQGMKTLVICGDSTYAAHLGYDAFGQHFDAQKGTWKSIYPSPMPVAYYTQGSDVFNVTTATYGTYLFQYDATQSGYCGFDAGEYIWVRVIVIPNAKAPYQKDTMVCKDFDWNSTNINPWTLLPASIQKAYADAGITATYVAGRSSIAQSPWTPADLPTSATGTESYDAFFQLAPAADLGLCSDSIKVRFNVHVVDSLGTITPRRDTICPEDIAGRASTAAGTVFGIAATGTWVPANVDFPNLAEDTNYEFKFTYDKNCKGNMETISFWLRIDKNATVMGHDKDTIFCKQVPVADTISLVKLYGNPLTTADFDGYGIYWKFMGTAAESPMLDGSAGTWTSVNQIDETLLSTSIPYLFKFRIDDAANTCFAGDSAILTVVAQSASTGTQDYRVQKCYDGEAYNMIAYDNLPGNAVFTAVAANGYTAGDVVANGIYPGANQILGTALFHYDVPAIGMCSQAKSGDFYVKITDKMVVPDTKNERFCVATLDPSVNLYNLIGVAPSPAPKSDTWTLGSIASYVDANGNFKIAQYYQDNKADVNAGGATANITVTFESGSDCLDKTVTLNIELTTVLF